jgi:hypothetical protein
MGNVRRCSTLGLIVVLGALGADGNRPQDELARNGLVRSGKFFVLPSEERVLQGFFNMRPSMAAMETRFGDWRSILQNEHEYQALGDYQLYLRGLLNDYNSQIAVMQERTAWDTIRKEQLARERNAVEVELRQAIFQFALRQKRLVGDLEKQRAEEVFNQAREDFLRAKERFWPQVDEISRRYDEIKQNESILNALREYNRQEKVSLKIGPSDNLAKKARQVKDYEREYSPETATQVKKPPTLKRLETKKKRGK